MKIKSLTFASIGCSIILGLLPVQETAAGSRERQVSSPPISLPKAESSHGQPLIAALAGVWHEQVSRRLGAPIGIE